MVAEYVEHSSGLVAFDVTALFNGGMLVCVCSLQRFHKTICWIRLEACGRQDQRRCPTVVKGTLSLPMHGWTHLLANHLP
jgi:hypothetical protein